MRMLTGKLYKRVSLFALSLVLAISGLGVAAPLYFSQIAHAVGSQVWTVKDSLFDDSQCVSTLQCKTIQAAVNGASSGDTINVAAGIYSEQVIINKNLTLQGAGRDSTKILSPASLTETGTGKSGILAVISPNPASPITVDISGITVDGQNQPIDNLVGVHFLAANGSLSNSRVTGMRDLTLGSQNRWGVFTNHSYDTLVPTHITISNNIVDNYQKAGIVATELGSTMTATGNTVTGAGPTTVIAQNGIESNYGASAIISGNNIVSGHNYTGLIDDYAAGILVVGNHLTGDPAQPSTSISGNTISDNEVGVAISTDTAFGYGDGLATINSNSITSNITGVKNDNLSGTLDATNNNWGTTVLDEIETLIDHNCTNSPYVHGSCNAEDNATFGFVKYAEITTPTNEGWNEASQSVNPNDTPLDLVCTLGGVYTNENSVAQNWSVVNGLNIKYQREVTFPNSSISLFNAGSNNYTPFSNFGAGDEGQWGTRVRAFVDANGNGSPDGSEETSAWSNPCKITYDKTAPTVPINGTPHNTTLSTNNFDFDWDNSTDSSPITYVFQSSQNPASSEDVLTAGPWTSGTLPTSMIHSSGAGDGKWYWQVKAIDAAGNESAWSQIWNVTLDTTAPSVPGNPSPADQSYVNTHDFTFSWDTVSDLSNPVSYEWEFSYGTAVEGDGSFTSRSGFHSLASASVNSPGTPDDIYYWHVRAIDSLGNASAWSPTWKVTVDTTAPNTPTTTQPAGDYTSDQSVTLTSSDSGSGLKNIYYTTDESDPINLGNLSRTLYTGAAITVDKDMTIKAVAYDNAGNASGVLTAVYGIAPIISGETSSSVSETTATITWTTDDLSTSRVIYDTVSHSTLGASPNYGYAHSTIEEDSTTKVTSHSVGLTGLTAGTTYYYRTLSHGSPEAVSTENSFTTSTIKTSADSSTPATLATALTAATYSTSAGTGAGADNNTILTDNGQGVLGASTTTPGTSSDITDPQANKTASVLGDSAKNNGNNVWSIFGLAWYWWVLILAAAGGAAWWLLAGSRHRAE